MGILHKLPVEEACRVARARDTSRPAEATSIGSDPAVEAYGEVIDGINRVRAEQRHAVDRGPDHDELARLVRLEKLTLGLAEAWREYLEERRT